MGTLLLRSLAAAMEEAPWSCASEGTPAGPREVSAATSAGEGYRAARRADALAVIAESFLAHGVVALSGGERHEMVLHVAAETLTSRDGGCVFPGCAHKRYVDGRHLQHWADGEALESVAHGQARPMRVDRVELPDLRWNAAATPRNRQTNSKAYA